MNSTLIIRLLLFAAFVLAFFSICSKQPVDPDEPCINDQPVEDTTRVYLRNVVDIDGTIIDIDTLQIYPKAIFVRFHLNVEDTIKINQLLEKHELIKYSGFSEIDQQLTTILCVPKHKRAEYYFTPYGKQTFCNFGADSMVEYSFGVFSEGYIYPSGNIVIKLSKDLPQDKIDSLFVSNGLRLISQKTDLFGDNLYWTLVTPKSPKNVLDLGYELQFVPFVISASTEIFTIGGFSPIRCGDTE